MGFTLTSPSFARDGEIPARFTCEGEGVSPALEWSEPPEETKSFALIMDDPDAPDPAAPLRTYVHWVLYNLRGSQRSLPEAMTAADLPAGTREGQSDGRRKGYMGPCPPIGRHRFFHKLYALDAVLPELGAATKADLERAMEGHVLAEAQVMGTYQSRGGR